MSIAQLVARDFLIIQIEGRPMLCNRVHGVSFVLFVSPTKCKHSPPAYEEFKKLVRKVSGVYLFIVNIDRNMDLVYMSNKTITKIDGTPYAMLYVDGIPTQIYDSPSHNMTFTFDVMHRFLTSMYPQVSKLVSPKMSNISDGVNGNNHSNTSNTGSAQPQGVYNNTPGYTNAVSVNQRPPKQLSREVKPPPQKSIYFVNVPKTARLNRTTI